MKWSIWVFALSFVAGCYREQAGDWVHPAYASLLKFAPSQSQQHQPVIWRAQDYSVELLSSDAGEKLENLVQGQKMVMVTYSPDSSFAKVVESASTTVGIFKQPDRHRALVLLANQNAVDSLAAQAHAAAGHMCGTVTPVALRGMAPPAEELIPPVYPEPALLNQVNSMLASVNDNNILANIQTLEAIGTRFHNSASGLATTAKVAELFRLAGDLEGRGAKIMEFEHSNPAITVATRQKSLIVSFPGVSDDTTTVVVGAHLDSINRLNNADAPGADDDASGIATLIEIARVIAESGARFHRRVEFHAYAAEEIGLIGSRDIANQYRSQGRKVSAMLQFDMNSWSRDPANQVIHLVTDDTHINLRRSLKDLLNTYLGGNYREKSLSAGTSDHRSWTDEGFAAVFPFEDPDDYNDALHTQQDTTSTANNFKLSQRFAQLGLAFLAHHAGIVDDSAVAAQQSLRQQTSMDLKLAITPKDDNAFQIHVATDSTIEAVDFCLTEAAGSLGCTRSRITTSQTKPNPPRRFFAPKSSLILTEGSRLAIFGFDSRDQLVAYRTVRLQQRR